MSELILPDNPLIRKVLLLQALRLRQKSFKLEQYDPKGLKFGKEHCKQVAFHQAGKFYSVRGFFGGNRTGKCLRLDEEVHMANGSRKLLKNINIGDQVLAYSMLTGHAIPAKVTNTFQSGFKDVFRARFSDGGYIDATNNHEFPGYVKSGRSTFRRGQIEKTLPKKRLLSEYADRVGNSVSKRPSLISPSLIIYEKQSLPIDPYAVGALLGDGSLGYDSVLITTADKVILDRVVSGLGDLVTGYSYDGNYGYRLNQKLIRNSKTGQFEQGKLSCKLESIGLRKIVRNTKFIPDCYFTASAEDRLELLAGLIDTDGDSEQFVQKSKLLTNDFARLVRSLGGKATISEVEKTCTNGANGPVTGTYWSCYYRLDRDIPLALKYKKRKRSKRIPDYSRRIVRSVERLGVFATGCIEVDHPDHCFIVGDFVVVGNSVGGGGEDAIHLTGRYPNWWEGKVFDHPVRWWAASDTGESTRDTIQRVLMGRPGEIGTGLIPRDAIINITKKRGIPDAIDTVEIRHKSGGVSELGFKSYDQGRKKFQGTSKHGIHLDEEPPYDVYRECQMRIADTDGIMMLTMTPLSGMSKVAMLFFGDDFEKSESRFRIMAGWEDNPWLNAEVMAALEKDLPPHELEARKSGKPQLGSGRIYPFTRDQVVVPTFVVPPVWPRGMGMDFGWKWTAASVQAYDEEGDTIYIYGEYKQGQMTPVNHAQALKAYGQMPIFGDPSCQQSGQDDGVKLLKLYTDAGLDITMADNAVAAGLLDCYQRYATGRLKIMSHCIGHLGEFDLYRRDDNGKVVKDNDHLMDGKRYGVRGLNKFEIVNKTRISISNYRKRNAPADTEAGY